MRTPIYKGVKTLAADLNEVATDWFLLGLQLGIKECDLTFLDSDVNTAAIFFRKTLMEWLRSSSNPTHDAIIDALKSPTVGQDALAGNLDSKEFRDKPLDLGVLIAELTTVTSQWYLFGIQLGVKPNRMDAFQSYSRDVRHKLNGMLQLWLRKVPRPTIQDLLKALRKECVGYIRLADDLETKYKGCKLDTVSKDEEEVDLNEQQT